MSWGPWGRCELQCRVDGFFKLDDGPTGLGQRARHIAEPAGRRPEVPHRHERATRVIGVRSHLNMTEGFAVSVRNIEQPYGDSFTT